MRISGTGSSASVALEDVARHAGVSRSTASRVVRGVVGVSQAKVNAVERAVRELHYIPNVAARTLVTRRTDSVAIVVSEPRRSVFFDPFFVDIVHTVSGATRERGKQLVMVFAQDKQYYHRLRPFLFGGHVDGAIIISHHHSNGNVRDFMRVSFQTVQNWPSGSPRRRTGWIQTITRVVVWPLSG